MDTKRFDAHGIRFDKTDRSEDAKRLTTLAKSVLRRATATDPRRLRLHGGMVNDYVQCILTRIHRFRNVKCEYGTSYQFLGILCIVEGDGSISSYTLELQEVSLALLWLSRKGLLIDSTAVQVSMTQLAIAVVVIEVMRKGEARRKTVGSRGGRSVWGRNKGCCPAVVKTRDSTASLTLRLGETHLRAAHGKAGSHGDASLLVIVDGTIEMIYHTLVFDNVRFMGKHLIVGLRRCYQVLALPTLPVQ